MTQKSSFVTYCFLFVFDAIALANGVAQRMIGIGLTQGISPYGYSAIGATYGRTNGSIDPKTTIIAFHTSDNVVGVATLSEKMRIDNNGNVGIGTISPQSELQVSGYVQLDLSTNSTPPSADCNTSSHYGRMKVDDYNDYLYICTQNGWISK